MKRIVAVLAVLCLTLLVAGVGPATAGHKDGHQTPPACEKGSKAPSQNKHCYPPRFSGNNEGHPASFEQDVPAGQGLTVGMATLVAVGGLGTLLLARRRWAFRTKP
jgi:hypothetical protein